MHAEVSVRHMVHTVHLNKLSENAPILHFYTELEFYVQ